MLLMSVEKDGFKYEVHCKRKRKRKRENSNSLTIKIYYHNNFLKSLEMTKLEWENSRLFKYWVATQLGDLKVGDKV